MTDDQRWRTLLTLLSLDTVAPFLSDMGLQTDDPERLRALTRRALKESESDPSGALRRFREQGPQDVLDWIEAFPYDAEVDGRALVWRQLLRRLAGISGLGYPLIDLPLARDLEAVREVIRRHLGDPGALSRRLKAAEVAPKSPWDEEIFRSYTEGASPLDWVANAIENRRTARAWDELAVMLSPQELETLRRWGPKQGEAMDMPSPPRSPH